MDRNARKEENDLPGLRIRRYRKADYEQVMALWREARLPLKPGGRDSPDSLARQVRGRTIVFLVAEREGRIVGSILASHDGRKGWINRLAVSARNGRLGLGAALVRRAERIFDGLGLKVAACLIEDWNAASIRFFEKMGFERHPEILYFVKKKRPDV